jgi:putative colanic acid biosynthesis acetyltransferase WcaF
VQITDLSKFENSWYSPGAGPVKRFFWYLTNACWFNSSFPVNSWKIFLLRLFGASIGTGVIVKPHVNIKYPWKLKVGDHTWIGEYVWIDNLADVSIGNNVCISQGAMLLCGNHDYKKTTFDLVVGEIVLEDGVWIGAKSLVCPKITCRTHSVLAAGSVLTGSMDAYTIYQGNPAVQVRERVIL